MASVIRTWGTQPDERTLTFPCDSFLLDPHDALYRGITIRARPEDVFRWLCQMRVAPYSYDWIDNLGRRSPRRLIPGLDQLAVGQSVMQIFELVDFARDQHLTLRIKPGSLASKLFGDVAISYRILAEGDGDQTCRLVAKLVVRHPRGPVGWLNRLVLPCGDLVMMRRQFLNFKALAEGTAGEREAREN